MAWWLTVYCRRSVAALSAEQVRAGITGGDREALAGVDYATLAEDYDGVDDSLAYEAARALAVSPRSDDPLDLELTFQPGLRPIVVHWSDEGARVGVEVQEAVELRNPPKIVRQSLGDVREVVMIEMAFTQVETMGIVFAFELARYLAQKGDGLIVDDDKRWWHVVRGAFEPLED